MYLYDEKAVEWCAIVHVFPTLNLVTLAMGEYLQHGNQQMLQRELFLSQSELLNIY